MNEWIPYKAGDLIVEATYYWIAYGNGWVDVGYRNGDRFCTEAMGELDDVTHYIPIQKPKAP